MDAIDAERAGLLIGIVLDRSARWDERDDAAMDLHQYPIDRVMEALRTVILDDSEEEVLRASAAESLAKIWVQRGEVDTKVYQRMSGVPKAEADGILRTKAPHLR